MNPTIEAIWKLARTAQTRTRNGSLFRAVRAVPTTSLFAPAKRNSQLRGCLAESLEGRAYLSVAFSPMTPFAVPGDSSVCAPVAADFNGDGKPDLLVGSTTLDSSGNPVFDVNVYLNKGNGTFGTPTTIATGLGSSNIVVGDFTGNGKIGFAVNNSEDADLRIYPGNGNGTFGPPIIIRDGTPHVGETTANTALVALDINGDGKLDLFAPDDTVADSPAYHTFLNNGNGLFTESASIPNVGVNSSTIPGFAAGDFTGNGRDDLVAGDSTDMFFYAANANGTLASPIMTPVKQGGVPVIGDFNGDGHLDVAMLGASGTVPERGVISVLLGNGIGTFQTERQTQSVTGAFDFEAADLNGDGKTDLVVSGSNQKVFTVQNGNGDGTFTAGTTFVILTANFAPAIADFNGDGKPDLAFNIADNRAQVFLNTGQGSGGGGGGGGTATITASISSKFPPSVVAGSKVKDHVTILLKDTGTGTFSGRVAVKLYLSPDGALDDAMQIGGGSKSASLQSGRSTSLPLTVTSIPALSTGAYELLAVATTESASTTATGSSIMIGPAFVKTTLSALRPVTAKVVPGKKATLSFTLTNTGNTTASGTADLNVGLSTDPSGSGPFTVATVPVHVKLKPDSHGNFKATFPMPVGVPAGAYFVTGSLDVAALNDATASDGIGVSTATLTVR